MTHLLNIISAYYQRDTYTYNVKVLGLRNIFQSIISPNYFFRIVWLPRRDRYRSHKSHSYELRLRKVFSSVHGQNTNFLEFLESILTNLSLLLTVDASFLAYFDNSDLATYTAATGG